MKPKGRQSNCFDRFRRMQYAKNLSNFAQMFRADAAAQTGGVFRLSWRL